MVVDYRVHSSSIPLKRLVIDCQVLLFCCIAFGCAFDKYYSFGYKDYFELIKDYNTAIPIKAENQPLSIREKILGRTILIILKKMSKVRK